MSDSSQIIWWVFILGVLASLILLVAVVSTLVVSHRRYVKLHRTHARRVLEAQEEERAWVSREVHDDAMQRLALIGKGCGDASRVIAGLSEEQARRLSALQAEVQDVSVFLRGLAHRLHPALIDRGGLLAALSGLGQEMERSYGLRVSVCLPVSEAMARVSPQGALVLYRIAQEALHNAAKHSGVSEAELALEVVNGGVELRVSDRGRGFDGAGAAGGEGIGLIGMKERAYLAEGQLAIRTQPGEGTVVSAWLPGGRRIGREGDGRAGRSTA